MIFYFSATGNCKHVASEISRVTGERMISITECMEAGEFTFSLNSEGKDAMLGLVVPTYAWGLPTIVCDFLKRLEISYGEMPYAYFVATYGTTPGQTGYFAEQYMREKGISFQSRFSIKMPDTWTPVFDLSNPDKVGKINQDADLQIRNMILAIADREKGNFMQRKVPLILAKALYAMGYPVLRRTGKFHVQDTCIGCGLCEKKCPVNAIQMENKRPVWVSKECVMCLGCLHHCPEFAIQYGKNTSKHGQYTHPAVKI